PIDSAQSTRRDDGGGDDSRDHAGSSDSMSAAPGLPAPAGKRVALPFRILGHDRHVAVAGGVTFSCTRETITMDTKISHLWSVLKDGVLLQSGCRTLNEAKNVCRAAAGKEHRPDAVR